ncbi:MULTISPECIES: beta-ketoacyl-ACP synthase III [Calditerrivibrio]|uniref:Beta-ketoacyl-[acyl-carrier-protein] synthase III n=1 Tax=Calditerrivibrio nitroreducens TaxID=477976 RepID=A0A2J6WJZ2_9BACT|nr:MAG: 3-oxoacyl-ACP synthase [Calditerrivibrio nitroreducens]
MYTKILGTGSYFPEKVLTNKDLEQMVDTTDEWITTRTGIKERRISVDEPNSVLGMKAAEKAIEMAQIDKNEISGIIVATFTPDTTMPSTACVIQNLLGIQNNSFAFDLAAACTGFIYALSVADSMIKSGIADKILVIGAERISPNVDWTDRNTCVLFGDGAGAVVLGKSKEPGFRSFHIHADGSANRLLTLDTLGSNFMANRKNMNIEENLLKMKGNEVFKIAVRAMAEATAKAVESSGLKYEEVDFFIPHQANLRIIDAAAKRINLTYEKVIITLDKFGNTSSATIPTALDIAVRDGRIKRGANIVSAAFGGGLTWGSTLFTF